MEGGENKDWKEGRIRIGGGGEHNYCFGRENKDWRREGRIRIGGGRENKDWREGRIRIGGGGENKDWRRRVGGGGGE